MVLESFFGFQRPGHSPHSELVLYASYKSCQVSNLTVVSCKATTHPTVACVGCADAAPQRLHVLWSMGGLIGRMHLPVFLPPMCSRRFKVSPPPQSHTRTRAYSSLMPLLLSHSTPTHSAQASCVPRPRGQFERRTLPCSCFVFDPPRCCLALCEPGCGGVERRSHISTEHRPTSRTTRHRDMAPNAELTRRQRPASNHPIKPSAARE